MPDYLKLTGTPDTARYQLPEDSRSYPSVPRPIEAVLREYMAQSPYLNEKDRANRTLEQQLDKVLSKSDRGINDIAVFIRKIFGVPGAEYAGSQRGTPVYVGTPQKGTSGGYQPATGDILLDKNLFGQRTYGGESPLDVLAHESGHAGTARVFGSRGFPKTSQTSGLTYNQVRANVVDAYNRMVTAPSSENAQRYSLAARQYRDHPVEQLAEWLGGLYGSWDDEPAQNPSVINKLYDAIYGTSVQTKDTAAMRGSGR